MNLQLAQALYKWPVEGIVGNRNACKMPNQGSFIIRCSLNFNQTIDIYKQKLLVTNSGRYSNSPQKNRTDIEVRVASCFVARFGLFNLIPERRRIGLRTIFLYYRDFV